MRIVFMGTPEYAEVILKELINKYEVVAVYTQPDKMVGRKKILTSSPVKNLALANKIKVFQPQNLKNEYTNIKRKEFTSNKPINPRFYCGGGIWANFTKRCFGYCTLYKFTCITSSKI